MLDLRKTFLGYYYATVSACSEVLDSSLNDFKTQTAEK
jgi:hypothetical protein